MIEKEEAPWGETAANIRLAYLEDIIQLSNADPNPKEFKAKEALKAIKKEKNRLAKRLFNL